MNNADLYEKLFDCFGKEATYIIRLITTGYSVNSAIQTVMVMERKNEKDYKI